MNACLIYSTNARSLHPPYNLGDLFQLSSKMLDIKQGKRENTMMMEPREHLSSLHSNTNFDWREVISAVVITLFLWLLGPFPLCCILLQRWAAQDAGKAGDRWGSIRLLAWLPLLYLPIILFRQPLSLFWQAHLPGSLDIWPPTLDGWLLRSVLALPLIPAGTLAQEQLQPRTIPIRHMRRLPRPGEVLESREEKGTATASPPAPNQQSLNTPPAVTQKATKGPTEPKPATQTRTRAKKERDPHPLVESLVEERDRRDQEKHKAVQQPALQGTPPNLQAQSSVDSTDGEEYQGPDPFKKKPIDWNRVKE